MRDFHVELNAIQHQIQEAHLETAKLQAIKESLNNRKSEILSLCKRLSVKTNLESIKTEISILEKDIANQIVTIDKLLNRKNNVDIGINQRGTTD